MVDQFDGESNKIIRIADLYSRRAAVLPEYVALFVITELNGADVDVPTLKFYFK